MACISACSMGVGVSSIVIICANYDGIESKSQMLCPLS